MAYFKRARCLPSQIGTTEDFRIELDAIFRDFVSNPSKQSHPFPSTMTNIQRRYVHEKCRNLGLKSKSYGKEPNRSLIVSKTETYSSREFFNLGFSKESCTAIEELLARHPIFGENVFPKRAKGCIRSYDPLGQELPPIINPPIPNPLMEFRKTLPIWSKKDEILEALRTHQIVIVSAETGSGKTTQIPQFILDSCRESGEMCRIICTQPRRISAVAVAERVAAERGEAVGITVGYKVRLECKVGPKTPLVYCTNGVMLRTLMGGDNCFNLMTHVIVDEIHERDRFSDFLLICLKECIKSFPNLRVILMSATINTTFFADYFGKACTVYIPGRLHPVVEYYLDDILVLLNYETPAMKDLRQMRERSGMGHTLFNISEFRAPEKPNSSDLSLSNEMNETITNCINNGSEDTFSQLMQLIISECASVDYQHTATGATPLIAAAIAGNLDVVEQLLHMGADTSIRSFDGYSAITWADMKNQRDVYNLLKAYSDERGLNYSDFQGPTVNQLLDYTQTVSDERIDYDLIVTIIANIHTKDKEGSILVFLPGYEDIINCQEKIMASTYFNVSKLEILTLHGSMQMSRQHLIFESIPNKQKVILSTNIAETSITIDDVVYVIDSGRAKEHSYDALSGSRALQLTWISKSCMKQRAGRAGRTKSGFCFHIYSSARKESFSSHQTPEILRVPLHELCLQTKLLAPTAVSIENFLALAIEPPSGASVKTSIRCLKSLGALDAVENLTPLGEHLVHLSVEPYLGKMLIYSVIFKCVDPVLTIVTCLAYKDPFVLPSSATLKSDAAKKRRELSEGSFSDHMTFLRAFQQWQAAKMNGTEKLFTATYYINSGTMEMISETRNHLLGQLRAAGFVRPRSPDTIHDLNVFAESWPLIKAALAVGLYPNTAFVHQSKIFTRSESKISVHVSSVLKNVYSDKGNFRYLRDVSSDWIIYEELSKLGKHCTIRCSSVITPATVALVCGRVTNNENNGLIITIDDWVEFEPPNRNILKFRQLLENAIDRKVNNPHQHTSATDNAIITTLKAVLSAEDAVKGLLQPCGIGNPPKSLFETSRFKSTHDSSRTNGSPYLNHFPIGTKPFLNEAVNGNSVSNENYFQGCNVQINNRNYWRSQDNSRQNKRAQSSRPRYTSDGLFKQGNCSKPFESPDDTWSQNMLLDTNRICKQDNLAPGYGRKLSCSNTTPQSSSLFVNLQHNLQTGLNISPRPEIPLNGCNVISVETLPVYMPTDTIFFLIKPNKMKSVEIGIQENCWLFAPHTERKIFKFFHAKLPVILIFTVHGTDSFQGIATLSGTNNGIPNAPSKILWLSTSQLSHHRSSHLKNSYAQNRHIYSCDDGQQLEPNAARMLCKLFFESIVPDNPRARPILGKACAKQKF